MIGFFFEVVSLDPLLARSHLLIFPLLLIMVDTDLLLDLLLSDILVLDKLLALDLLLLSLLRMLIPMLLY